MNTVLLSNNDHYNTRTCNNNIIQFTNSSVAWPAATKEYTRFSARPPL